MTILRVITYVLASLASLCVIVVTIYAGVLYYQVGQAVGQVLNPPASSTVELTPSGPPVDYAPGVPE